MSTIFREKGGSRCILVACHTVDALLDGLCAPGIASAAERIRKKTDRHLEHNHQTFLHNWYDDMGGLPGALRLWDQAENDACRDQVFDLGRREDGLE